SSAAAIAMSDAEKSVKDANAASSAALVAKSNANNAATSAKAAADQAEMDEKIASKAAQDAENALKLIKQIANELDNIYYANTKIPDQNSYYIEGKNNGINDFFNTLQSKPDLSNLNKYKYVDGYQTGFDETKKGYYDAINNRTKDINGTETYSLGYQAGNDYLKGVYDARHGISINKNGSTYYKAGYSGTKNGLSNRISDNSEMKGIYQSAFDKAREIFPMYVYNVKGLHVHNNSQFSENNRKKYYGKNNNVFKVIGIEHTNSGKIRYIIKGGYITGNSSFVKNLYYQKIDNVQKVRVISKNGAKLFSSPHMTGKRFSKAKPNQVFDIVRTVKYKNETRFYLSNGKYLTTSKLIVKKLNN
uniref:DUF5776 domain-containing protein n=1 Tax=Apilactobacillus xinyiensis TaxID=2841032 RepID=UPI003364C5FF